MIARSSSSPRRRAFSVCMERERERERVEEHFVKKALIKVKKNSVTLLPTPRLLLTNDERLDETITHITKATKDYYPPEMGGITATSLPLESHLHPLPCTRNRPISRPFQNRRFFPVLFNQSDFGRGHVRRRKGGRRGRGGERNSLGLCSSRLPSGGEVKDGDGDSSGHV